MRASRVGRLVRLGAVLSVSTVLSVAAEPVEVVRDLWGVPHVFAASDRGAMFGAGYATAEDRLYQMHRARMTVQGRLSELEGIRTGTGGKTTLDQDKLFLARRYYDAVQVVAENLDPGTRMLLEAYADGVNAFIAEHEASLSSLFHGVTPERWTVADSLACVNRVAEFFGGGIDTGEAAALHDLEAAGSCEAYKQQHPSRVVIDEAAAVVQREDLSAGEIDALCEFAAAVGYPCAGSGSPGGSGRSGGPHVTDRDYASFSHAWAVGGSSQTTPGATVVSMPQTAITFPAIFHEIHVVGATFDARGFAFPGSPGFLIGFSRDVAWGVTALGIDISDTFRLTLTADGAGYLYDGEVKPIHTAPRTIRVRESDGSLTEVPTTVRWTEMGPLISELMPGRGAGEEYVLLAVPLVDTGEHTVRAMIGMMRARSAAEFATALGLWRFPAVHCVFGDRTGAVGYWSLCAIPIRSSLSCLGGVAAQDGSSSGHAWQGFIPSALRPHVLKAGGGEIFSANHIPVGAWYPIPLHLGTGGSGLGDRGWRLQQLLREDPAATLSAAEVEGLWRDDVNAVRREVVRAGVYLRDTDSGRTPSLSTAALANLELLDDWLAAGAHSRLDQPHLAGALGMEVNFRYREDTAWAGLVARWGSTNIAHWLKDLRARLDAWYAGGTPFVLGDDERAFIDNALATGYANANRSYGPAPGGWMARLTQTLGTLTVPYQGSLDGFGSLDPRHDLRFSGVTAPDGGTVESQRSQAGVIAMLLSSPDTSVALMPPSGGEDLAGPFAASQVQGWLAQELRAAPLSRDAVASIEVSRRVLAYEPRPRVRPRLP